MDHSLAGGVTLRHVTFTSHQRRPLTRFGIDTIVHRLITMIELKEVLRLWREGLLDDSRARVTYVEPARTIASKTRRPTRARAPKINSDLRKGLGGATEYLRHRCWRRDREANA